MKRSALVTPAGVLLLSAILHAQQPPGYLVLGLKASSPTSTQPAILFLDPLTGTATPVTSLAPGTLTHATALAQGPTSADILVVGAASGGGGTPPWIWQFPLAGNRYPAANVLAPVSLPPGTLPHRMAYCSAAQGVVFTIQGGAANDLYFMSAASKVVTRANTNIAATTALAGDVLVIGNKAYAAFYNTTGTRQGIVVEWALTGQSKPVTIYTGTNPVVGMALNQLGLWLVNDTGDIDLMVNTNPGFVAPIRLFTTGLTGSLAIVMPDLLTAYLAVANKQGGTDIVQCLNNGAKTVFTDPRAFGDLNFSIINQGGVLFYGGACPGNAGTPRMSVPGYPTRGNTSFAVAMQGGPANAPSLLAIGTARANTSLASMGAPGCFLFNDALVVLGGTTTVTGTASIIARVPTNPSLSGLHVFGQWGIADRTANAAGLITTEGAEYVIY